MSTNTYLQGVASKLVLSDTEKESIRKSIDTLKLHLRNWEHYDSIEYHDYFGSFSRGTILPRQYDSESDIDYMIKFKDAFNITPQTYLNWLKQFANKYYSRSEIHQDYPTIALELNHIKFELVPAVCPWGGNELQIPAPKSAILNWINTDPEQLRIYEQNANVRSGSILKPMIRLMKYWNIRNGRIVSSYELEKYLSSFLYFGCKTLEDHFYYAAENMYFAGLSQTGRYKLDRLKEKVRQIKQYKSQWNDIKAEETLKGIFQFNI